MDSRIKKIAGIGGMVFFALAVAVLAAHYNFPYRPLALKARQGLEESFPIRLEFKGPEPGFPFSVFIRDIKTGIVQADEILPFFRVQGFRLSFSPLSMAAGRFKASFSSKDSSVRTAGIVEYRPGSEKVLSLNVTELDIPDFMMTMPEKSGTVQGRVKGSFFLTGGLEKDSLEGEGIIKIESGRLEGLKIPQLPLTSLDFDLMTFSFKIKKSIVQVSSIEISSPQGGMNLAGVISNLQAPVVNLNGSAYMGSKENPLTRVQIRITGPAMKPRINVVNPRTN